MHFFKCIERKEIMHPKMQNPKAQHEEAVLL